MTAGLSVATMFLAATASTGQASTPRGVYGPAPSEPPRPVTAASVPVQRECAPQEKDPKSSEIVVCALKPQGYRLDPDILKARRMKKQNDAGRPHNPHETYADHSCATVGPMGCRGGPTINLVAAAATAVTMVQKAVTGQNVGKMFVTDPHPSEYQLYLEAKAEREQKEKEAKTKAAKPSQGPEAPAGATTQSATVARPLTTPKPASQE